MLSEDLKSFSHWGTNIYVQTKIYVKKAIALRTSDTKFMMDDNYEAANRKKGNVGSSSTSRAEGNTVCIAKFSDQWRNLQPWLSMRDALRGLSRFTKKQHEISKKKKKTEYSSEANTGAEAGT